LKHFIRSRLIYLVQQNPFSQLMGFRPLFCVRARLVGKVLFQPSARWAIQPPMSATRGKDCVFSHPLNSFSASSALSFRSARCFGSTSVSFFAPYCFSRS